MRQRKPDLQFQISRLERKHHELDARAAELDRQLFQSAQERLLVVALKKEKLATKDALSSLQRDD